ncbi:hypothetical protein E2P86_15750 [Sphingobacterium psychroaquaticum]|uniref:hypothetical protein n=1 Tax=Sphingobacterium psychroaquaticum TaxID=561061 RepID=UPI00106C449A|nr:hypothetical protein [Sphingobacterium psychroaquaticum]QBQ42518.1 hypothetical protein E2P86_15750 [Sphingobacterium psychroaquaticum]
MTYKIGDLVRFVDEPIEGHITSFQANNIVGVTDETGFEIPVPQNKITLVHGNMKREDDDLVRTPTPNAPFIERGIFLAIEGEQKEGLAKFFIVNRTSYDILVSLSEISGTKRTGLFAEKIMRKDFVQVYSANFSNLGKWPTFQIQIIKHSKHPHQPTAPIDKEYRVKPLDLVNSKELDEIMNSKVWLFELDKPEENIGLDKLKDHFISHRPSKK